MMKTLFILLIIVNSINIILPGQNTIIDITFYAILVCILLYSIIDGIKFSKRSFFCLNCEKEFRLKWYQFFLLNLNWRDAKKYRRYKTIDTGTFERVYVKCPKCKEMDCIIK